MNISEFLPNVHYHVLSIFAKIKTGIEHKNGKNYGSLDMKLLNDPNIYKYVTSLSGDALKISWPLSLMHFPGFKSIKITNFGLFNFGHDDMPDNVSGPIFVYHSNFQKLKSGIKYYITPEHAQCFPYTQARKIQINAEIIRYDNPIFDSTYDEIDILDPCQPELVSELQTNKLRVTCNNNVQYLLANARCKKLVLETTSDLEIGELSADIQTVVTKQEKINSSVQSLLVDRYNSRFARMKPVY